MEWIKGHGVSLARRAAPLPPCWNPSQNGGVLSLSLSLSLFGVGGVRRCSGKAAPQTPSSRDHAREVNSGGGAGDVGVVVCSASSHFVSSLALMGIQLTPPISIMKLRSGCKRRPFGALNSHLINQRGVRLREHLRAPGVLPSFEMLSALLSFPSACWARRPALSSRTSRHFSCHAQPPLGGGGPGGEAGGDQSFISVQLTSVQLS